MVIEQIKSKEGILLVAVLEVLKVKGIINQTEMDKLFSNMPMNVFTAAEMIKHIDEALGGE